MKINQILSIAFRLVMVNLAVAMLGSESVLAHQAKTQTVFEFSLNPAMQDSTVGMAATATFTGEFKNGKTAGHGPLESAGDLVADGDTLQFEMLQLDGAGAACGTSGATYAAIGTATTTDGIAALVPDFDTTDLGGQMIGMRAVHQTGGDPGPHRSAQSESDCMDLMIRLEDPLADGALSAVADLEPLSDLLLNIDPVRDYVDGTLDRMYDPILTTGGALGSCADLAPEDDVCDPGTDTLNALGSKVDELDEMGTTLADVLDAQDALENSGADEVEINGELVSSDDVALILALAGQAFADGTPSGFLIEPAMEQLPIPLPEPSGIAQISFGIAMLIGFGLGRRRSKS